MLDERLDFNDSIDSNDIINTTVTKEIHYNIKQHDLSRAIRTIHKIIKPAIDSCRKSIRKVAAIRRELTLDQCDTLACLLNMYDAISREEAQEALRVGMLIGQDSSKK